jgi:hypothetical protein
MTQAKRTRPNPDSAGYNAGRFCARYWPSARIGRPYLTSMVQHRNECVENCMRDWPMRLHARFEEGFELGYEDEALDRAEAGIAGYEGVTEAGCVDAAPNVVAHSVTLAQRMRIEEAMSQVAAIEAHVQAAYAIHDQQPQLAIT